MKDSDFKITDFSDYRIYLNSYVLAKRQSSRRWNLRLWSRQMGLKDVSSLTKILNGQRNPGASLINKLANHFRFNREDHEHFKKLVQLSKYHRKMGECLVGETDKIPTPFRMLDLKLFDAISDWHHFAIREMTRLRTFDPDPASIIKSFRFPVTVSQVRKSLTLLQDLNLIKVSKGKYSYQEGAVEALSEVPNIAIKQHHVQCLKNAANAVENFSLQDCEVGSSTFVIPQNRIAEARETLREMRRKFMSEFDTREPGRDVVYHVQFSFFPITKVEGNVDEK